MRGSAGRNVGELASKEELREKNEKQQLETPPITMQKGQAFKLQTEEGVEEEDRLERSKRKGGRAEDGRIPVEVDPTSAPSASHHDDDELRPG